MAFRVASYWDLEGTFDAGAEKDPRMFPGELHSLDGTRVASGSDFGLRRPAEGQEGTRVHLDRAAAEGLLDALRDTSYAVRSVESKPYRRQPYAPFRTTTMQQEASRKLGMSASVAMSVAQRLYENGFITYMRTDSTTLSSGGDQRGPLAGPRAVRRGVPARQAARLRQQGQERPGGARGDPAGRRVVPYAGADRADRRAVPALRADLDAHRRLTDEGRRRTVGLGPDRRHGGRRARRGVRGVRPGDHLPRLPQGLRRGHRRRQALRRRPGAGCPTCARATRSARPRSTRPATRPSRRRATPRPR